MANRAPYPQQRPPQGGLGKFRATIQQSDDLPLPPGIANPGNSVEVARANHVHPWGDDPQGGMGGIYTWAIRANVIAPQSNPTAMPWIFAQKVYIPHGLAMTHYGLSLAGAGLKAHGNVYCGVWSGSLAESYPIAEYVAARVLFFAYGKPAGFNLTPLTAMGVMSVTIAPGWSWIIAVVEKWGLRNVEPLLDYQDAVSNNGFAWGVPVNGFPGWPSGTWDSAHSVAQTKQPLIYIL